MEVFNKKENAWVPRPAEMDDETFAMFQAAGLTRDAAAPEEAPIEEDIPEPEIEVITGFKPKSLMERGMQTASPNGVTKEDLFNAAKSMTWTGMGEELGQHLPWNEQEYPLASEIAKGALIGTGGIIDGVSAAALFFPPTAVPSAVVKAAPGAIAGSIKAANAIGGTGRNLGSFISKGVLLGKPTATPVLRPGSKALAKEAGAAKVAAKEANAVVKETDQAINQVKNNFINDVKSGNMTEEIFDSYINYFAKSKDIRATQMGEKIAADKIAGMAASDIGLYTPYSATEKIFRGLGELGERALLSKGYNFAKEKRLEQDSLKQDSLLKQGVSR